MSKSWAQFYEARLKSEYYKYFVKRYEPFLQFTESIIKSSNAMHVVEEGCGMGNTIRYLNDKGVSAYMGASDISPDMLAIAIKNINHRGIYFYLDNILDTTEEADVLHSHGVLEHFSDDQIRHIIKSQKRRSSHIIHYVPSDKYKEPSFGDERLMSPDRWIELVDPDEVMEFNDGYDLILYWDSSNDNLNELK